MQLPGSAVERQEDLVGVGLPEEQFSGGSLEAEDGWREAERTAQQGGMPKCWVQERFPCSLLDLLPVPQLYPASKWEMGIGRGSGVQQPVS